MNNFITYIIIGVAVPIILAIITKLAAKGNHSLSFNGLLPDGDPFLKRIGELRSIRNNRLLLFMLTIVLSVVLSWLFYNDFLPSDIAIFVVWGLLLMMPTGFITLIGFLVNHSNLKRAYFDYARIKFDGKREIYSKMSLDELKKEFDRVKPEGRIYRNVFTGNYCVKTQIAMFYLHLILFLFFTSCLYGTLMSSGDTEGFLLALAMSGFWLYSIYTLLYYQFEFRFDLKEQKITSRLLFGRTGYVNNNLKSLKEIDIYDAGGDGGFYVAFQLDFKHGEKVKIRLGNPSESDVFRLLIFVEMLRRIEGMRENKTQIISH